MGLKLALGLDYMFTKTLGIGVELNYFPTWYVSVSHPWVLWNDISVAVYAKFKI
jgi:hypothetical protein